VHELPSAVLQSFKQEVVSEMRVPKPPQKAQVTGAGHHFDTASGLSSQVDFGLGPTFLVYLHIVTCCLSLVFVAGFYAGLEIIQFDEIGLNAALLNVALFSLISVIFALTRFSFGYFLGFYFYTMILGYVWLVQFSRFNYDHLTADVSAFVSALAFVLPALLVTSPIKQSYILSARTLDILQAAIMALAAIIIAVAGIYNFRLVSISAIYDFRDELEFPTWLRYAIGVESDALLPFAFSWFVMRRKRWLAAAVLVLLLLFYPITLSKFALFAPFWLLFLALLSGLVEARTAVVMSLFLPLLIGVVLAGLTELDLVPYSYVVDYFGIVNFRMVAIPSAALDLYGDFFSTHDLTYFCQISFLKAVVACPYSEPLAIIMRKAYGIGNLNASLFATEGIASVGPIMTPLVVLACGFAASFANRLSSGLPPRFILLSAGTLPQLFLNVPLSITIATHGASLVFLLWYLVPRSAFDEPE
jgi:hypothetical protein